VDKHCTPGRFQTPPLRCGIACSTSTAGCGAPGILWTPLIQRLLNQVFLPTNAHTRCRTRLVTTPFSLNADNAFATAGFVPHRRRVHFGRDVDAGIQTAFAAHACETYSSLSGAVMFVRREALRLTGTTDFLPLFFSFTIRTRSATYAHRAATSPLRWHRLTPLPGVALAGAFLVDAPSPGPTCAVDLAFLVGISSFRCILFINAT